MQQQQLEWMWPKKLTPTLKTEMRALEKINYLYQENQKLREKLRIYKDATLRIRAHYETKLSDRQRKIDQLIGETIRLHKGITNGNQ